MEWTRALGIGLAILGLSTAGCGSSGGGGNDAGGGSDTGGGGNDAGTGSDSGAGNDAAGGDASTSPALTITSPTEGGTATAASNMVSIEFTLTGATLAAPGACAGDPACGHIHVLVDGTACNAGGPYNNAAVASPAMADMSKCATATGSHTFTLELHHDDHSAFDPPVSASVTATVQ